jgi:V/A-type H+/Na+-transporting ATPase subunit F
MDVKIAAFGEKDIMLIFKAAGIDVFPLSGDISEIDEAEKKFRQLVGSNYGIIFVTETVALKLDHLIREFSEKFQPSVVVIPGPGKRNNYAVNDLRRIIIKAIGVDIMTEKEIGVIK